MTAKKEFFKEYPIGAPANVYADTVLIGETTVDSGKLKFNQETVSNKLAKTGNNPRETFIIKDDFSFEGAISEATLAQIAALTGNTLVTGTAADSVRIKSKIGTKLTKKSVVIKPIIAGVETTDESYHIFMPSATITSNSEVSFALESQKDFAFIIEAHPVTADEIASGGRLAADDIAWVAGDFGQIGVESDT